MILVDKNIRSSGYEIDVGIAAENITLAAMEMGIGSCMMGAIDRDALRDEFNIAQQYEISLVMALGYPAQKSVAVEMESPDKYKYWLTEDGILHVPKRPLDEIIID